MSKLRVWWYPQVGINEAFYVPVKTVEDGKRMLDTLAAYDAFQLQYKIKGDYCNTGGLQYFDEEEQEWNDWFYESDTEYFDNVDEYCESEMCLEKEELEQFSHDVLRQIDWEKIRQMVG